MGMNLKIYYFPRYEVNMELNDKNLSLQFYNYLCNIIGSEEVVRTRRDIFTLTLLKHLLP